MVVVLIELVVDGVVGVVVVVVDGVVGVVVGVCFVYLPVVKVTGPVPKL